MKFLFAEEDECVPMQSIVSDVAATGNHGKNLKNVARDALRLFFEEEQMATDLHGKHH